MGGGCHEDDVEEGAHCDVAGLGGQQVEHYQGNRCSDGVLEYLPDLPSPTFALLSLPGLLLLLADGHVGSMLKLTAHHTAQVDHGGGREDQLNASTDSNSSDEARH